MIDLRTAIAERTAQLASLGDPENMAALLALLRLLYETGGRTCRSDGCSKAMSMLCRSCRDWVMTMR